MPVSMMTPEETEEISSVLPQHKSGPSPTLASPTLASASLPLLTAPTQISTNPEDATEHLENISRRPSKAAKRRQRKLKKQADHPPGVIEKKNVRPRRCARHANAGSLSDPNADRELRELKKRSRQKHTSKPNKKPRRQSRTNKRNTNTSKPNKKPRRQSHTNKRNTKRVKKRLFPKNQKPVQIQDDEDDEDERKSHAEFMKGRIWKMKQWDMDKGVMPVKGMRVAKLFGKEQKDFYGTITGVDLDEYGLELYHVLYDDEDEEDLYYRECRNAVLLFRRLDEDEKRWA